jgi:hypothetical protein
MVIASFIAKQALPDIRLASAAWLSELVGYVSQSDSVAGGSVSYHRTRFPGIRLLRCTGRSEPTAANRDGLRAFITPETTKWQYVHGVSDESLIAPESYALDSLLLGRPGNDDIQLDLFLDYAGNVALYPKFQAYFRSHRPPLLAGDDKRVVTMRIRMSAM